MKNKFLFAFLLAMNAMLITHVSVFASVPEQIDAQIEASKSELQELQQQLGDLQQQLDETAIMNNAGVDQEVQTLEVRARITKIASDETVDGVRQMNFIAEADGETYEVDTSRSMFEGLRYNLNIGDRVYLQVIKVGDTIDQIYLVDSVRTGSLALLLAFFAIVVLIVGHGRGLLSMLGLAVTMLLLFGAMIPAILAGRDPVLVTVIGSAIILIVNMMLSHGASKSTMRALASTLVGLLLAYVFAKLFVGIADLSGLASEESILLYLQSEVVHVPQGILLSGIILGATGVLDDIAITQSETVEELHVANPKMTQKELFVAAMRVGRHHIASTVNTLVLAYAGVALPLLLLFMAHPEVTGIRFLNEEPIAEEIVRTLAGTMALVLTVPISTWFATLENRKK